MGGSFDTYRSIVNLGSGPKLLGAEFTITDPKHRAFDRIDVRAYSWGDEPYATFHLTANKAKLYDFNADYRDIAYFNFLPSFADPLLARGVVLNQQSFDIRRHFASFELDLLPGHWLIPYFAYDRDSGSGTGATTFVTDGNQYAVPNQLRDLTNLYRGGVRFDSDGCMPRSNRAAPRSRTIRASIRAAAQRTSATCQRRCWGRRSA